MRSPTSIDDEDAIISTYVWHYGISSPLTLRSHFFLSVLYYLYLVYETRKCKNKTDWCDDPIYRIIFYLVDMLSLDIYIEFLRSLERVITFCLPLHCEKNKRTAD